MKADKIYSSPISITNAVMLYECVLYSGTAGACFEGEIPRALLHVDRL